MVGLFGACWGLIGIGLLLSSAIYRLTQVALESFNHKYTWTWLHWVALVANILFMAHSEGYKGFQKAFSPRVAARALYLKNNPNFLFSLFAPLFCMGYFHATKKRKIVSVCLTLGIVTLILLVRMVDQPWRGIIDVGVVVGLTWGLISIVVFAIRAFGGYPFDYLPEVPESKE